MNTCVANIEIVKARKKVSFTVKWFVQHQFLMAVLFVVWSIGVWGTIRPYIHNYFSSEVESHEIYSLSSAV